MNQSVKFLSEKKNWRKGEKSFIYLCFAQQFAEIDAQVGVVFVDAKFFTDVAAHIVVASHLDVGAHFSSFQPHGIKAAIVDFPFGESMLFQMIDEMGMRCHEGQSGGIHESILVFQHLFSCSSCSRVFSCSAMILWDRLVR